MESSRTKLTRADKESSSIDHSLEGANDTSASSPVEVEAAHLGYALMPVVCVLGYESTYWNSPKHPSPKRNHRGLCKRDSEE